MKVMFEMHKVPPSGVHENSTHLLEKLLNQNALI